ncbi:hypothetical protein ACFW7P_16520 [Streptomyces albidoflavus]
MTRPTGARARASADGLRRTFPAQPAGDTAATTWWGRAWVTALTGQSRDPGRLARGSDLAARGSVDAVTVTPGLVLAYVHGSRPRPYRARLRVRPLTDEDWTRLLDHIADHPAHLAALLDRELPPALAGGPVPLLPGAGDLIPDCTCPDPVRPCKHAAALCHRTARLLDQDPFVLLLLRGRGEDDLIDTLTRLSVTRAAPAPAGDETPDDEAGDPYRPPPLPGVRARDVLAAGPRPPVPPPPPVPAGHAAPPSYPSGHGGPDPLALDQLATQAAARAHALLATGRDPLAGLGHWADAVRIAAARPGSGLTSAARDLYARLARAAGRDVTDLHRAVAAWQLGGEAGLVALEEPWDPPAGPFDRARPTLLAAGHPRLRPERNRLTHPAGDRQLRLGRDGLWYGYISDPGREDWWPTATPGLDPVAVFGALPGGGA